jgi:hypothetical protein
MVARVQDEEGQWATLKQVVPAVRSQQKAVARGGRRVGAAGSLSAEELCWGGSGRAGGR